VWNAIKKLLDKVAQDLGSITPPPHIGGGGSFSLKSLWDSIKDWVTWACDSAAKLAQAALDALKGLLNVAGTVIVDMVKAVTYLIKKALYELYKAIRFFLVRTAYAMPFTDELDDTIAGSVSARSLWTAPRRPFGSFPFEEVPDPERTKILSPYAPWATPEMLPQVQALAQPLEMPATWPGPYKTMATPDALLDPPAGPRVMLAPSGPNAGPLSLAALPNTSTGMPDFGGAVANCAVAFKSVTKALAANTLTPTFFPDYNLDGDRGYAWPCWDVSTPPKGLNPVNSAGVPHPVNVTPAVVT
jgi:hypothetical protein